MYKEQVNNVVILRTLLHVNKLLNKFKHMHTCACAREGTFSKVSIQHRADDGVTGVATMPESPEAKFSKLL